MGASRFLQAARAHRRRSSEDVSLAFLLVLLAGDSLRRAGRAPMRNPLSAPSVRSRLSRNRVPSLRRSVTSTLSLGFGLSGSLPPAQLNKCMALPFFDIPDHVLVGYMDAGEPNKVIDYIKAAKRAGKEDVVRRGCVLFAFGLKDRIEKFVARKFPSEDRDEVAAGAILEITRTLLEKTPRMIPMP